MGKLGTLEPVFYFVNFRDPAHPPGYILLAPYTGCRPPDGYQSEYADTLAAVDRLQRTLQRQERQQWERELEGDETRMRARYDAIGDALRTKMVSSSTSAYEREFIALYLRLRDEKRDRHRQRFTERVCYLTAREFDTPRGRRVDSERP